MIRIFDHAPTLQPDGIPLLKPCSSASSFEPPLMSLSQIFPPHRGHGGLCRSSLLPPLPLLLLQQSHLSHLRPTVSSLLTCCLSNNFPPRLLSAPGGGFPVRLRKGNLQQGAALALAIVRSPISPSAVFMLFKRQRRLRRSRMVATSAIVLGHATTFIRVCLAATLRQHVPICPGLSPVARGERWHRPVARGQRQMQNPPVMEYR
jgi:hypothetical protein